MAGVRAAANNATWASPMSPATHAASTPGHVTQARPRLIRRRAVATGSRQRTATQAAADRAPESCQVPPASKAAISASWASDEFSGSLRSIRAGTAATIAERTLNMQKLTPCLWFDTEAEEAATFYTSIFKDSRILHVARYGKAGPGPEGSVLTVRFELDGQEFVALNGGPQFTFNEAVSFQVSCESQDDVDEFWSRLSAGGEEGPCGWLKDRYGVSWQIIPTRLEELLDDPDPERSERAMRAMLQMKKIEIATLEEAAMPAPAR